MGRFNPPIRFVPTEFDNVPTGLARGIHYGGQIKIKKTWKNNSCENKRDTRPDGSIIKLVRNSNFTTKIVKKS